MLRKYIQNNSLRGFWVISASAFIVAPFLTNDGVCLLFVEPLLSVFEVTDEASDKCTNLVNSEEKSSMTESVSLNSNDAIYFLLTLSCRLEEICA